MHMIRSERKKLEWNEGITGHTVAQRALYSCMIYCSNLLLSARVYPPAFGQRLLRIWESSDLGDVPLRSLRNISAYIFNTCMINIFKAVCRRRATSIQGQSDREVFQKMELGDPWPDADLYSVFLYLWTSSGTCIPDSWKECMNKFAVEFRDAVVADVNLISEYNALVARGS